MSAFRRFSALGLAVCAMLLQSCGGGESSPLPSSVSSSTPTPSVSSTPPQPGTGTQSKASVIMQITSNNDRAVSLIQRHFSGGSGGRKPMYVSASTLGLLITVSPGGYSQAYNVSSGSPLCTTGNPRTCTISIPAPVGADTFTLTEYDAVPVGGAIPGGAHALATSTLNQTIVANTANTLTFYADGIIAGVATSGGSTFGSLPADGSAHSYGVALVNTDADGNVITTSSNTPYNNPITVSLSEVGASGHSYLVLNGANVGTSATIKYASDTLSVHYDGGGSPGYYTSTAFSSSGASGTSLQVSPMYLTGSLAATDAGQTNSASISEANAPGNVAYSTSWSCSGFSRSITGSGASATVAVTSPVATAGQSLLSSYSCSNITVSDNYGSSVSLGVSAAIPVVGTCSSQASNIYLGAKNGSSQYEVGSGSPCALSASASSLALYALPNPTGYSNSAAFSVSESNDTRAPSYDTSPCGSGVSAANGMSGAGSYTGTAGGNVTVTQANYVASLSCSTTLSDGNGQTKAIPVSVTPDVTASNVSLTIANPACARHQVSVDIWWTCAAHGSLKSIASFTNPTDSLNANYTVTQTADSTNGASAELMLYDSANSTYYDLPNGTVKLPSGSGSYSVYIYTVEPYADSSGGPCAPCSDAFSVSGDVATTASGSGAITLTADTPVP